MTHEEETALEIKIEAVRAEIKLRFDAHDKAEELYHKEIDRRLDNLNHANERLDTVQTRTVSAEVYSVQHKVVVDQINSLQTFKDNQQGRQIIIPFAISFLTSVIFIIINYFLNH